MKLFYVYLLASAFCISMILSTNGQVPKGSRSYDRNTKLESERKIRENTERSLSALRRLGNSTVTNTYVSTKSKKIYLKKIKSKLKVDLKDISDNESFLKDSNTGIFKLLPLPECVPLNQVVPGFNANNEQEVSRSFECFQENEVLKFFANAYSFREKKHLIIYKSDLVLEKGFLVTPEASVQTILVNLGDIQLNKVTLDSEGMKFLVSFKPKPLINDAVIQSLQIRDSITVGSYIYRNSLPVEENSTIALRSIAYSDSTASSGKNADVIIVFRIVRRQLDGAVTILWKELSRQKGIELKN